MSKHTKGPWKVKYESDYSLEYSIYSGNRLLFNVHLADSEIVSLVSAAPEMLEALEAVIRLEQGLEDDKEVMRLVKRARNKARGGSNETD